MNHQHSYTLEFCFSFHKTSQILVNSSFLFYFLNKESNIFIHMLNLYYIYSFGKLCSIESTVTSINTCTYISSIGQKRFHLHFIQITLLLYYLFQFTPISELGTSFLEINSNRKYF